jgi:Tol biopolymer transport system component
LFALGRFRAAIQVYDTCTGADPLRRSRFLYRLRKHAFYLLGAGKPIEIPPELAHHTALSALQEAADYYDHLAAKAKRLVPRTLGHASWSPDGRQIAYSQTLIYPDGADALAAWMPAMAVPVGIEILNVDSGARRPLVSSGINPTWSPDGKWIAFAKTQKGTWGGTNDEIWIISKAGSEPRRVAKGTWPFWGRDTQYLYFLRRDENMLYRIRIGDLVGAPEPMISCPGWYPTLSPDERYLTYALGSELRLVDLSTGVATTLWVAPGHQMHVNWSPRGNELSVGGPYGSRLGVWIFDVRIGQAAHVFDAPAYKLIWSADGSRVALHVHQPFEEIWWTHVDPNLPTCQALAPARTCGEYLRHRRAQCIRAADVYGHDMEGTLKNLALVAADQCRLGDFQEALETLADIDELCTSTGQEPRPWDVALQALALLEVEGAEAAAAALERLRSVLENTAGTTHGRVHSAPMPVPRINSQGRDYSPTIAADSLSLLFTSSRGGYGSQDLWIATRRTAVDTWSEPENVGSPVNTAACEAHPCLAADGLSLYFCDGRGNDDMPRRPGGLGASDIWVTRRPTVDGLWEEPVNLGPIVNGMHHERAPCISANGLSLFFDSDRPGGMGVSDIWMAARHSVHAPWKTPVNLGPPINSAGWEGEPSLANDGLTLYFCSTRPDGYGGIDIWMTKRTDRNGTWGRAANLGPLVNTSSGDVSPEACADGSALYFSSRRAGGLGFWDVWQVPARQLSVDMTQDDALLHLAKSLVEAEFGKGVIPRKE